MTKFFGVSALALALALFVGCGDTTEPAKSPGAKTAPAEEQTFKLTLPSGATNVAKGGEEQVTIEVDRGENLKSEIALNFETPKGITIEPANAKIAADQTEVEVMVKATADAPAGEQSIKVEGEGDGKKTSGTFKVEVTDGEGIGDKLPGTNNE